LKRYADRRPPLASAAAASPTRVVQESGLSYHVNLSDNLDTGLPLDLRLLRATIRKLAAGNRFLSLYGNTGSLAVAAAAGGPASASIIDPLEVHVYWTRENLALNGFAEPQHQVICSSPNEYLQHAAAVDLVTIEDPTQADAGGTSQPSPFQHQHVALIRAVLPHLAPHGVLYVISHDRRFKPSFDELAECEAREITHQTLPEDFSRNRRIHRVWRIVRRRDP
jgi:23S rRNA (guanine2445-N2)-methyltransferase / 23S rRNA (guanine2069-N7)-methyltransferase